MERKPRAAWWVSVLVAAAACSDRPAPWCEPLDHRVEDRVTIREGVFGQLRSGSDVPMCWHRYGQAMGVAVLDRAPAHAEVVSPRQESEGDARGFFEFSLPPGRYWLCVGGRSPRGGFQTEDCSAALTVQAGQVQRRDWEAGREPPWE